MSQTIESVLSQVQRNSLTIEDFIFHIIDPDLEGDQKVVFLDEVQLEEKQKTFFLDRLRDVAEGTQYIFKPDSVHLQEKCQQLLIEPNRFNEISRQITENFASRHEAQMSAGVFVIAVVRYLARIENWKKLVLLIKMDKRPSFSYTHSELDGRRVAVMSEVPNALNETKAAIQKSAVIDASNNFAWNVLAFDRIKKPLLSDYYKGFLGVVERHEDSELTRKAHITVKKWAFKLTQDQMPPGEDALSYTGRALNYLTDHTIFETETFIDAVVRDDDPQRKIKLASQLREELVTIGVAGQQFAPRPNSLPGKQRRQVYKTAEGVTIIFEGDKNTAGLKVEDKAGGGKRVIIETGELTINKS